MKITNRLQNFFSKFDKKKIKKDCIVNIKNILSEKNEKKKEEELKELFEFLSSLLYKDLEKDVVKIQINLLEKKKKNLLFRNLRKIFKTLLLFKNEKDYIEMLCDFLFYLFKYMRKINVRKCYKLIRGISSASQLYGNNCLKDDNRGRRGSLTDELLKREVTTNDDDNEVTCTTERSNNIVGNNNNEGSNRKHLERGRSKIPTCMSAHNDLLFHFLLNSNILIYLEMLKKGSSKNLQYEEHYFFMNLKKSMINKKYILKLCDLVIFIILNYPNFPIFIDTLFNLFFFVRNNLITFFLNNIYKRVSDIFILKNNEINKNFTVKKYYNLLFYVYFLYKIKMFTYLYLYPKKCAFLLNDHVNAKDIMEFYTRILNNYKNSLYCCFYEINKKKNAKSWQNFCLVIIYLVNFIYTSHKSILNVFPRITSNYILFKKYKDVFLHYHKIFDTLFKFNQDSNLTNMKIMSIICSSLCRDKKYCTDALMNKKKKKKKKKIDTKIRQTGQNDSGEDNIGKDEHRGLINPIIEEAKKKKEKTKEEITKFEMYKLLYRIIPDGNSSISIISGNGGSSNVGNSSCAYSCALSFHFLYALTSRCVRLYNFPTILRDAIFYKKLLIQKIYKEKNEEEQLRSSNSTTSGKVSLLEYTKNLYNNSFLNLIKNKFCLYMNIDQNILNIFLINEFDKFLTSKNLNYRNFYLLMFYKTDKYYQINILLFFQKIILRNVLKYALLVGCKGGDHNSQACGMADSVIGSVHGGTIKTSTALGEAVDGKESNMKISNCVAEDCLTDDGEEFVQVRIEEHPRQSRHVAYFFKKENAKLKMLHMNEFNICSKDINRIISKASENTFIVLKNLDFIDLTCSDKNFLFDKNAINILLYQMTKESFNLFKFLHSFSLKKKEDTNIYVKNLSFLEAILKCIYNFVNSFYSISKLTRSGKKCVLCCNDKKQFVLFTNNYYEQIKNKKMKTRVTEKNVYLRFEKNFNRKCAKGKNFKIMKNLIKLYVTTIIEKNKKEKYFCTTEEIEIAKMILFVFNFMIFYMTNNLNNENNLNKQCEKKRINGKQLKKRYCDIFTHIHVFPNLIKRYKDKKQTARDDLKKELIRFSKNYSFIGKQLNSNVDKNYFIFFTNYNFLQINKENKDFQTCRQIYNLFKSVTLEMVFSSGTLPTKEDEIVEEHGEEQKEQSPSASMCVSETVTVTVTATATATATANGGDQQQESEDDIVISGGSLLDILAENAKKEKKSLIMKRKKIRTDLFYNVINLLKYLKINIKEQSAEGVIRTLHYLLQSLVMISRKVKMIAKREQILVEQLGDVAVVQEKWRGKQVQQDNSEMGGRNGRDGREEQDKTVDRSTNDGMYTDTHVDMLEVMGESSDDVTRADVCEITNGELYDGTNKTDKKGANGGDSCSGSSSSGSDNGSVGGSDNGSVGGSDNGSVGGSESVSYDQSMNASAQYMRDMAYLEKKIRHFLLCFKVNKNVKVKEPNKLKGLIENFTLKIMRILTKEKKNKDLIKITIRCLENYSTLESYILLGNHNMLRCRNSLENKIRSNKHIVVTYLFHFLEMLDVLPQVNRYYSKFFNLFFKSSFVRYININEMFNSCYKKYFCRVIHKFASDLNIHDYIKNKIKIQTINSQQKQELCERILLMIKKYNKKVYVIDEDLYRKCINSVINNHRSNNKILLNSFTLNVLSHIVQNICIHFNKILKNKNAYEFKKKISFSLLVLLKKISTIIHIQDDKNLQHFKDQLVNYHFVEITNFQKCLDKELCNQSIRININDYVKKLAHVLQGLKFTQRTCDNNILNEGRAINIPTITTQGKEHKKRSAPPHARDRKKIK
ncbi:conserved Plasmodium protein, unknown function [Plasmodium malariae]|uniref:Uncharacterized protein n=1 Tax=Plasmodium malariae TaxID=5858 RepID=A0A1C3L3A0_PLAMA|nr:conserved Plasmodium protein, unknown function [Plasmodium malariae]